MTSKTVKQFVSFGFAGVVAVTMLGVLFHLQDSLAYISAALGLAAGWGFGILLAPYQSEQKRFKTYTKVAAGFITGYLVSKADRVVDLWLDPVRGPLILNVLIAHRVLLCLTGFILSTIVTYVGRKYLSFGPGAEGERVVDSTAKS